MIKRYGLDSSCECGRMDNDVEYESPDGDWVRFADHDAEVTALREALAECARELRSYVVSTNDSYLNPHLPFDVSIEMVRRAEKLLKGEE